MSVKTWTAKSGGNWSASGNWSGGTPISTDSALIQAGATSAYGVTLNLSLSISALTINDSFANVTTASSTTARQITFSGATTITNGGLTLGNSHVTFKTGSLSVSGGSFTDAGSAVTVTGNANFTGGTNTFSSGSFTTGTLTAGSGALLTLSGGSISDTGGGIVNSGTINGFGTLGESGGSISGSGNVDSSGGVLDIKSNVGSTVALQVGSAAGSTTELEGSVASGGAATFNGSPAGTSTLDLHTSTALASFNGGGADLNDFDFIASSATPTIVEQVDAETIAFANVASATLTNGNTTITLFDSSHSALATFTLKGTLPTGTPFVDWKQDAGTGTDIFLSSVVCFAEGTRILTADGEVAVEELNEGDMVVTLRDDERALQPIKWIGQRRLELGLHPHPVLAAPVRIRRGAFADGLPQRDLVVSPDHCLFIDGKLIPAKLLINGMTIVQELESRLVAYRHVELEQHAILLAEGLPTESYLDTGNRAYFSNSGLALVLHPEFHVNAGLKCWAEDACAPLAVSAEAVLPVWRMLAERAKSQGFVSPSFVTTEDADLRLVADGRTYRAVSVEHGRHIFMLLGAASDIRLVSRTAVPSQDKSYLDDWRRLGVAVRRIVVREGDDVFDFAPDHPHFDQGWYRCERKEANMWRWTNGDAQLPFTSDGGVVTVEVQMGPSLRYHLHETAAEAARLAA
ncbi:MAG TPA: Hint domain-containing protein [Acetobacteraceae bacterium]|nr:Hint domain-containing protein [Acetobacteraceae bacterium]